MFSLSKLRELSPRTRLRKILRILQAIEVDHRGAVPDAAYIDGLMALLCTEAAADVSGLARVVRADVARGADPEKLLRGFNAIRHALLHALGAEPAEWDLVSSETGMLDRTGVRVLPFSVYLEDVRSPFNVGSIFRTAEAFGAERILLSPRTPPPTHPRAVRTARGAADALPWETAELDSLRGKKNVFALELGGTALGQFHFPSSGTVLVGSEELGLSPEALAIADACAGRVTIPLAGAKRSLNVSVAFGILMQAWRDSAAAQLRGIPRKGGTSVLRGTR
jgi:TrmH family RNA methyltransferase